MERLFGQTAARRRKLYNSKIECTYFSFLGPKPAPKAGSRGGAEVAEEEMQAGETQPSGDLSAEEVEHLDLESMASADSAPESPTPPTPPSAISAPPREPAGPAFGGLRERDEREAAEFGRCLANNLRHLRKYPTRGITNFRVYERDVPDVPLIVDRYEAASGELWFHAAEYERQHSRSAAQQADWFDLMRRTIAETAEVPPVRVVMKEKHRQRGLTQHEKVADTRGTIVVQEGGLRFEVNLTDYIDTGLFLDHRLTRQMFKDQAAGKHVLNLFCYTGSFTVYAASGGAASTTSVDLSNTYLDWARRNLGLNNLYSAKHAFIRSDVMEFIRSAPRPPGGAFDLVMLDPPTFSNSSSTEQDWEVQHSHVELLTQLAPLLSPQAVVHFSTNFRRFKLDEASAAEAGVPQQAHPPVLADGEPGARRSDGGLRRASGIPGAQGRRAGAGCGCGH
jgi:23S rRNA (guanine2445-N2)-methyltransferase / 23S rRNA (guanine2069-N7)-methyltransferase